MLARSAVNRKLGGSNPPEDDHFSDRTCILRTKGSTYTACNGIFPNEETFLRGAIGLRVRLLTERLEVRILPGTIILVITAVFSQQRALGMPCIASYYLQKKVVSVAQSVSAFGC